MKTLYVLRHAKSSWDNPDLSDFDRPLNKRGLEAAPFMGRFMRERGFAPQLIISSPAVRARNTAELVRDAADMTAAIRLDERIYEATPITLREVVSETDDAIRSVMIVGHNPGAESFIRLLSGRTEAMPTAALAVIELNVKRWSDTCDECGVVRGIYRPKHLAADKV